MNHDGVRRVADAVLYEGYILYPYRASAQKNRSRWQFGVLMPPGYAAVDPSESSVLQTECVLEYTGHSAVEVVVRFLQVQRRQTSGAPNSETPASAWDEAVEREVTVTASGPALLREGTVTSFTVPGGADTEMVSGARVVRRRAALGGSVEVRARPLPGPWQAARLTVRVTNESADPVPLGGTSAGREDALPAALVAAHLIITVSGGAFLSMTDPPEWASPHVGECDNRGCWPVLAGANGSRQVMLAAPIILPDYPEVAAESPGELYDGTEIDEILTLRTLALSDEEKAAARATDPRAAALIDRIDAMDEAAIQQLHGTIRGMRSAGRPAGPAVGPAGFPAGGGEPAAFPADGGAGAPWWDPGADESVSPGTDAVMVAGHRVARGSRVILRPGAHRADAQDMFLAGRAALVEAVLLDVDDKAYLAVTLADDPAADLQSAHGRFLYFSPDEVEPGGLEPSERDPAGPGGAGQ